MKRLIGRKFNDKTVQHDMLMWPFKVVNRDTKPYVEIEVRATRAICDGHVVVSWRR